MATLYNKVEFRSFFHQFMRDNYSDKAADKAFEEIDADGSGELSATEFNEGLS